jgi:thioredoxin 1
MVAPILDELAEEYSGKISFVKVDVDQNPKTAARYGIMSIPTLLIFKNGEPISHIVGFRPKEELKRSLEGALEQA